MYLLQLNNQWWDSPYVSKEAENNFRETNSCIVICCRMKVSYMTECALMFFLLINICYRVLNSLQVTWGWCYTHLPMPCWAFLPPHVNFLPERPWICTSWGLTMPWSLWRMASRRPELLPAALTSLFLPWTDVSVLLGLTVQVQQLGLPTWYAYIKKTFHHSP